jgi:hypothetical protein
VARRSRDGVRWWRLRDAAATTSPSHRCAMGPSLSSAEPVNLSTLAPCGEL